VKVDVERIPESQVELTIEVEPETVDKYVHRAYRSLVNRLNIPGFRKGKAPRFIVERTVGKETLFQEGLELLLPDIFNKAIEENNIQPVDRPEFDVAQTEPLVVKAKVPVVPTVQLGNYRDIRLTKEEPKVTDEQVESVIEHLREQHTEWLPTDRPAAMGDRVTVDIEAHVKGESLLEGVGGEALVQRPGEQLLNAKGTEYPLKPQPDAPIPELAEQIVGLSAGQEKQFELRLPDSYPEPQYAGKVAVFRVAVQAVREKHSPEIDDEFAKMVGDYSSVAELRASVREQMQQTLDAEAEKKLADTVIQMVVDRSTVEIPKVMIEREAERFVREVENRVRQQGLSFEQYLRTQGKTRDQAIQEALPAAEKRLRNSLVLNEIARAENLEVSPQEIDEEIDRVAERLGDQAENVREALNTDENRKELSYSLWDRKVVKFLTDIALRGDSEETQSEAGASSTAEVATDQEAESDQAP